MNAPATGLPEGAYVAALASLPDVGPARLRGLMSQGPPESVWRRVREGRAVGSRMAGEEETQRGAPSVELIRRWRFHAQQPWPERMKERLDRLGIEVWHGITLPPRLRDDMEPPGAVFARGVLPEAGVLRVGVVGTRRASAYGLRIAEALGRDLSSAGVVVVSGLALGIDAAAHRGALQGYAPVIAVIGGPHDRPCPSRNRSLAAEVTGRGCVMTEVPPGVASAPWRFPARNRCIAALCDVVVVVESPAAGGSMLTVVAALDRDRSVMAVPGPVDRRTSEGCHLLLRDGAQVCTGADDVLGLLGLVGAAGSADWSAVPVPGGLAGEILDLVCDEPLTTEAVMTRTGASLGDLSAALVELEQADLVHRKGGWIGRGTGGRR